MTQVNRDPVFGIRKAVASGMVSIGMQPNKELIDAVVDHLPDFFKQPLQAAESQSEVLGLRRERGSYGIPEMERD